MTSHQRILSILDRRPVDRIPVDIWCAPEVLDSLRVHTGQTDELAVYASLGLDKIAWVMPVRDEASAPGIKRNIWGVPMRRATAGAATYNEAADPPFAGFDSPAQLDAYPHWPGAAQFDVALAKSKAGQARARGFATIGPWISLFEIYCQLRGLENALIDVIEESPLLESALDRIESIQTAMLRRMLAGPGDLPDIVFISDDMGTQNSLLLSTAAWDRHFKARLVRWCDLIHAHGKKVLFHSDGAILPLIPRLIDAGVDILNPIQHVCPGMERRELKARFGDRLVFHGGVENQNVLPFGTPAEVRAETLACLETLGRGNAGYICCSCHKVQAGTPVENILAMIETVQTAPPF
jgi:uroporphyrinogen decarboxylase